MKVKTRRDHLKILLQSAAPGLAGSCCAKATVAAGRTSVARLAMEFMEEFDAPGLSIAIAREGKFICRKAFGVANIKAGERLTVDHRFRIASVSKPITSAAIFLLIERGKLSLDDRVFGKDALLGITDPTDRLGKITVHHLLTHTSGGWKNDKTDPMFKHLEKDHLELISWAIKTLAQANEPGEKYAYSNFGYCLLGRIIEKVSGQTYEEFVAENVLRSCGIETMQIAGKRGSLKSEVSYYKEGKPLSFKMNVRRMDAHGGWVGTPGDLVNFALRVDGSSEPPDILKKESLQTMTERNGVRPGYACGWSVNQAGNYWHGGSLPGLSSLLVRTSGGYCWAACVNTRSEDLGSALDRLMWKMINAI